MHDALHPFSYGIIISVRGLLCGLFLVSNFLLQRSTTASSKLMEVSVLGMCDFSRVAAALPHSLELSAGPFSENRVLYSKMRQYRPNGLSPVPESDSIYKGHSRLGNRHEI